jgi:UDP-glucose 4-epimerase
MLTLHHSLPQSPARIVLMGAGGFVGRECSELFRRAGYPMLGLSRNHVDLLAPGASAVLGDLLEPDDTLIVTSALAPVKNTTMLVDNIRMMEAVIHAVKAKPVRHIVYVSSDAVYKDSLQPLTEASCAEPGSLHGAMHLAREVMLRNELSIPTVMVRPTLIYGAGDPHNGYGPNRFVRLAKAGQDIVLFGKGEERRDHVYIGDVAAIIHQCVLHGAAGEVNAVSGKVASFREIAEMVVGLTGSTSRIVESRRLGTMPHNGYRPFDRGLCSQIFPDLVATPLGEGLTKTLAS